MIDVRGGDDIPEEATNGNNLIKKELPDVTDDEDNDLLTPPDCNDVSLCKTNQ